jgi:hypothetical protein
MLTEGNIIGVMLAGATKVSYPSNRIYKIEIVGM